MGKSDSEPSIEKEWVSKAVLLLSSVFKCTVEDTESFLGLWLRRQVSCVNSDASKPQRSCPLAEPLTSGLQNPLREEVQKLDL